MSSIQARFRNLKSSWNRVNKKHRISGFLTTSALHSIRSFSSGPRQIFPSWRTNVGGKFRMSPLSFVFLVPAATLVSLALDKSWLNYQDDMIYSEPTPEEEARFRWAYGPAYIQLPRPDSVPWRWRSDDDDDDDHIVRRYVATAQEEEEESEDSDELESEVEFSEDKHGDVEHRTTEAELDRDGRDSKREHENADRAKANNDKSHINTSIRKSAAGSSSLATSDYSGKLVKKCEGDLNARTEGRRNPVRRARAVNQNK
ncbi:hypothetical protein BDN70DRAFT_895389 [Pholiota conissans]|uniref:Uncharacterized protein n=1 Tax=Pholiota conissans TaxID=109636 RepID=A0A9P6CT11_9AGAR|nr:hypothetical protein BDN70DRAFT_895389 [Pholiota conissans]